MFRGIAVLLGLSLFAIAEGVCALFGWGNPTDYPDPYVGFSEIHPLFVKDDAGENYVVPKSRRGYFQKQSFPVEKNAQTFRIFCFGGSTVWGRPYAAETAFPKWLELSLSAGDERRNWQVINCGGVSYASYRLAPIVKECRNYKPDLFVICTGHNEFLEARTYDHIKNASPLLAIPSRTLSRLRTTTLLRSAVDSITGRKPAISENRPELKSEVDAQLDYKDGLKAYQRDTKLRAKIVDHFEFNLRRMIDFARNADVPVILMLPPSDLRMTPPFKSQHKDDLTEADTTRWKDLIDRARALYASDLAEAVKLLEQAAKIDHEHAATAYELGQRYYMLWERTKDADHLRNARTALVAARDLDICPLRMVTKLEDAMRRVAHATSTPLIDAHALLEVDCPGKVMDNTFLVDHIHPSPMVGHQRLAQAIAMLMREQKWFRPDEGWPQRRNIAYRAHRRSLPDIYFAKHKIRLEALRNWAKGRAPDNQPAGD